MCRLLRLDCDVFVSQRPWRIALFTPSDQSMRFSSCGGAWHAGREVMVAAGGTVTQRCWLMFHSGDASVAWKAFHRFAHREEFAVPDWAREMKVHYYDFLSSATGEKGRRGDGYETDLPHFREFRVGLATQHGCYPTIGDFICPDRKTWQAMRGDKQEPVRYLAALGDKPWRACAWHFQKMWSDQMKLARQVGAGIGVSNGWIEYTGLTRLPPDVKGKMLADIAELTEVAWVTS